MALSFTVYVGVYGYGYIEAGKNVFQLFHNRGWEAIIADVRFSVALLSATRLFSMSLTRCHSLFVTTGFVGFVFVIDEF